jgi:thiol-disulfide isomerase/thioredoxin
VSIILNREKQFIFFGIILIVLFLAGCLRGTSNNDENTNYQESFEFQELNGKIRNTSEFHGKVLLIDFFGVRCTPCQYQMLVLNDIYEEYKGNNFEIISIDVWMEQETPALIEQFIQEYKQEMDIDLDWIFGYDDAKGTLLNEYANSGVPTLLILDKNGNVYYQNAGYTEYSYLAEKIDELI